MPCPAWTSRRCPPHVPQAPGQQLPGALQRRGWSHKRLLQVGATTGKQQRRAAGRQVPHHAPAALSACVLGPKTAAVMHRSTQAQLPQHTCCSAELASLRAHQQWANELITQLIRRVGDAERPARQEAARLLQEVQTLRVSRPQRGHRPCLRREPASREHPGWCAGARGRSLPSALARLLSAARPPRSASSCVEVLAPAYCASC